MDGEGQLTLTGQLGDVMKESAHLAISWLRSNAKKYHLTNGEWPAVGRRGREPGDAVSPGTQIQTSFDRPSNLSPRETLVPTQGLSGEC